jgi:S-adenosylmethionine decarboxylase
MRFLKTYFFAGLLYFGFISASNLPSVACLSTKCFEQSEFVGTHVIAELLGCTVPEDQETLEKVMRGAAKESNSTALEFVMHKFEPYGVTAILILAESHISVHSWPEKKYAGVDVFTCGQHTDPVKAIEYLKNAFNASEAKIDVIKRGIK